MSVAAPADLRDSMLEQAQPYLSESPPLGDERPEATTDDPGQWHALVGIAILIVIFLTLSWIGQLMSHPASP